jgi:hypothetical protein
MFRYEKDWLRLQLGHPLLGALDRADHELREEAHEQGDQNESAVGFLSEFEFRRPV